MKKEDLTSLNLRALGLGAGVPHPDPGGCPDDETFAAFYDGVLSEKDAAPVRSPLAECTACLRAFRALKETEAIEGPPVPAHLIAGAFRLAPIAEIKKAAEPVGRAVIRILKSALEVLKLDNIELGAGLQPAHEAVRSGGGKPAAELLEIKSPLPVVERITLQKIEPDDVRLTVCPSGDAVSQPGFRHRIDLFKDDSLIQSWPLEEGELPLEPVAKGLYRLDVIRIEEAPGAMPETIGSIDITLEADS